MLNMFSMRSKNVMDEMFLHLPNICNLIEFKINIATEKNFFLSSNPVRIGGTTRLAMTKMITI